MMDKGRMARTHPEDTSPTRLWGWRLIKPHQLNYQKREVVCSIHDSKRTAGIAMIQAEQKYLDESLEAASLPNQLYTSVTTYEEAMRAARALTE